MCCISHLTLVHLTFDPVSLQHVRWERLDGEQQVSRGITVFISECLREKALNQTGRVTLTLNGRERERERDAEDSGVRFKLTFQVYEHTPHSHTHAQILSTDFLIG